MDAKTFLSGLASPLAEGSRGQPGKAQSSQEPDASNVRSVATPAPSASGASESVSEQDSPLVFSDTTPSGIVVEYEAKPRRLYRVNGIEVPSVTTVLDALSKDGLKFWGQDVGVRAILELFNRGRLATTIDWQGEGSQVLVAVDGAAHEHATIDNLKKLITAEKLSCNHVLNKAADRGTNVHDALEQWAKAGGQFFPTPQNFPEEERPYVEALLNWLLQIDGAAEVAGYEVMVGSAEHGFAGRYDLTIILNESRTFVRKAYKRKEDLLVTVAPGRYTIDAKTSSGVYTSHFRQLAGYEIASVESGYEPTDGQFVLHLMKDGRYEFVPSYATAEDFLSVLAVYQTEQRLKGK